MKIEYISEKAYRLSEISIDLTSQLFCVFDLEGTGIHVNKEFITQFGAVLIHNGEMIREFRSLVHAPKPIPNSVAALTGITNESLQSAPGFPEVYNKFLEFCGDATVVTQAGYEYDIPMLKKHCKMHQLTMLNNDVIDTKAMFAHIHRDRDDVFSTDYLIQHYNLDVADAQRHDALGDCIIINRIFQKMLNDYTTRGLQRFEVADGIEIKRFIVPQMYEE